MNWETKEQLEDLICRLVSWESRSGTEGEVRFPFRLKEELFKLDYFWHQPEYLEMYEAGGGRNAISALYKTEKSEDTIVLMSHFDTVHTKEYGAASHLACAPRELTDYFKKITDDFPQNIQTDIFSDEYLFGRGTMDMKMGLTLHMHLIEKAYKEDWPVNILLLTVPDEEVDSAGMRSAMENLDQLREKHGLSFSLFLNSEPSFSQKPEDPNYYIYSGSIGKIMPSALFYGVETHAGEPLSGLNAHYMSSFLNQRMEFTDAFTETAYDEQTPLPVTLKNYDLKEDYNTQTSNHVAALYNVFMMEQNVDDIFTKYHSIVKEAMEACQSQYENICTRENITPVGHIDTMTYDALHQYTLEKLGREETESIISEYVSRDDLDDREKSMRIADRMITRSKELVPLAVTFFAPPFYPSVNASESGLVQDIVRFTQTYLGENYGIHPIEVHYFNGISDLSYVTYDSHDDSWETYKDNTPVWGMTYTVPFEEMQKFQVPFINIGPYGKDAHKLTERLHKENAFETTPKLLVKMVENFFIAR
ncbi:M20/M25/M40 family metallo-hydrolase [Salinicoccus albus]|uniref:M20/M25/M40 family metallo-hydrolase n=1 Tax=Salinicoccus albus TaxID=418756 RepID=UPI00035E4137|nr:M20/M25/M40 family metallo-hydrolase [Salinicoccus albus]